MSNVSEKVSKWQSKNKRRFVYMYIIGLLGGVGFGVSYCLAPVMVRDLLENRSQTVFINKPIKEEPKTKVDNIETLLDYIHNSESSGGKNNYSKCEAIGLYNEYGFSIPGDGSFLCFEKGLDREAVRGWLIMQRAKGLKDREMLCFYNTGKRSDHCAYVDNFSIDNIEIMN